MERVTQIVSKTVVIPNDDIDTDQIIPARFLTTTTKEGLGRNLFADWRYEKDGGERKDFVLNRPESRGLTVLVGGNNFGCGSSREHAPWALLDFGIHAVISTEIADIFRSNSLKNGLVPVIVDAVTHRWLIEHPGAAVKIDVPSATIEVNGKTVPFPIDRFSRYCLINGIDQLGYLLEQNAAITRYEQAQA
ncbi:MAG: 3-isopropylmalate dehydratase small subunit [Gammaproteobacteria bacterium]